MSDVMLSVVGYRATVKDTDYAKRDVVQDSWEHLKGQAGIIKAEQGDPPNATYAIEFPFQFPGGHTCNGFTKPHQGHYFVYGNFDIDYSVKESV